MNPHFNTNKDIIQGTTKQFIYAKRTDYQTIQESNQGKQAQARAASDALNRKQRRTEASRLRKA